jgi:UPF0176 protein
MERIFIQNQVLVSIEENEINGDILIKGMTTGEQQLVITEMQVNDIKADKVAGDVCTFQLPFRIRLSDKLYKVLN